MTIQLKRLLVKLLMIELENLVMIVVVVHMFFVVRLQNMLLYVISFLLYVIDLLLHMINLLPHGLNLLCGGWSASCGCWHSCGSCSCCELVGLMLLIVNNNVKVAVVVVYSIYVIHSIVHICRKLGNKIFLVLCSRRKKEKSVFCYETKMISYCYEK